MRRAFLLHLLRIAIGYVSAGLLAAVIAPAILWLLHPVAHYLISEGPLWGIVIATWPAGGLLSSFMFATEVLLLVSLVPGSLLIIISEWRGIKSRKWFMMTGVLVSSLTILTLTYLVYEAAPQIWKGEFKPARFLLAAFATFIVGLPSALAAGAAYWAIAGRRSGVWGDLVAKAASNAASART
jgi:uncharacterized membrane protein (UPF0136 family)